MAVSIQNVLFTSNDANSHKSQREQASQNFRIHSVLKFKVGGGGGKKIKNKQTGKQKTNGQRKSHHTSIALSLGL